MSRRLTRRAGSVIAITVTALATAVVPAAAQSPRPSHHGGGDGSLNILLTNDDGYGAPGIEAVRQALEEAGHDVTVVAPADNQSGVGTKARVHGELSARQVSRDAWKVGGSPSDCVLFALQVVMPDDPPDLVVSGANFGQNVGTAVNRSGTVGATMTALQAGIPAIAVSAERDPDLGKQATLRAFPRTADLTVELVEALQQRPGERLLPAGRTLNVNTPVFSRGESVEGVARTVVGDRRILQLTYRKTGDGTYQVVPSLADDAETRRRADTTALARDKISITPLDGDWTAQRRDAGWLRSTVRSLARR